MLRFILSEDWEQEHTMFTIPDEAEITHLVTSHWKYKEGMSDALNLVINVWRRDGVLGTEVSPRDFLHRLTGALREAHRIYSGFQLYMFEHMMWVSFSEMFIAAVVPPEYRQETFALLNK